MVKYRLAKDLIRHNPFGEKLFSSMSISKVLSIKLPSSMVAKQPS